MTNNLAIFAHNAPIEKAEKDVRYCTNNMRPFFPDLEARPYVLTCDKTPLPSHLGGDYCLPEMREQKPDDGFENEFWMVHGGSAGFGTCGRAPKPGIVSLIAWDCGPEVGPHEWGHNLGLGHSGMHYPDGSFDVYGDRSTDMGKGNGLNAPQMHYFGLIEPLVIALPQTITLAPLYTPPESLFPHEATCVVVNGIYLSTPSVRGHRLAMPETFRGAVMVYEMKASNATLRFAPDCREGQIKELPNGGSIEHLGMDGDSVILRVTLTGE